ncbi:hypothetical protein SARC_13031 [Sphaeroforma arctica JP610]|uniref:Uncharacterized protein n=1 Tax=Sphaeroforma arctica JP610 TaxID=667725 RepID=A0A0L0FCC7_9EUKA|nr:hypothetical protein SARC_13031 [Sphaeroforma arctica JP610]KNC74420.1 hypothetical protein SARC_13031 [Sphaeroforma arctica JP610]|eukprot:XP_014148322.1 hypothetical protein SARC_13031 [Sphaeroforma arctica JP610]
MECLWSWDICGWVVVCWDWCGLPPHRFIQLKLRRDGSAKYIQTGGCSGTRTLLHLIICAPLFIPLPVGNDVLEFISQLANVMDCDKILALAKAYAGHSLHSSSVPPELKASLYPKHVRPLQAGPDSAQALQS